MAAAERAVLQYPPMSLGLVFKGPEGIVLAADSRVTLTVMQQLPNGQQVLIPATYDHASKLLTSKAQPYVAAVTFGAGVIGQNEPRTAVSFMPEFDTEIGAQRLSVEQFAERLGAFFDKQWKKAGMDPNPPQGQEMIFFVAGYDEGAPYGRAFEVKVPINLKPVESLPDFGVQWGGQREVVDRLIQGFDFRLPEVVENILGKHDPDLEKKLKEQFALPIPWQFLPLQDCIDVVISMLRVTITLQQWMIGVRGVGGAIDVATITRMDGFQTRANKANTR